MLNFIETGRQTPPPYTEVRGQLQNRQRFADLLKDTSGGRTPADMTVLHPSCGMEGSKSNGPISTPADVMEKQPAVKVRMSSVKSAVVQFD